MVRHHSLGSIWFIIITCHVINMIPTYSSPVHAAIHILYINTHTHTYRGHDSDLYQPCACCLSHMCVQIYRYRYRYPVWWFYEIAECKNKWVSVSCAFSWALPSLCFFVQFQSLVFILSCILLLSLCSLFSNEREKGSVSWWARIWGGTMRSRRRRDCSPDISCVKKNLFSIKRKMLRNENLLPPLC